MLVTLSGMMMLSRLLQPENAPAPMLVTLSGIVMLVRLLHPANALAAMPTVPCRNAIFAPYGM